MLHLVLSSIFIEDFCLLLTKSMAYLANFEEINQEKCDSSKVFQFFVESGDSETSKSFDSLKSLECSRVLYRSRRSSPTFAS